MSDLQIVRTQEELEALPVISVVIDGDGFAYQRDTEQLWSSCGRWFGSQQVSLPVVVLYNGGDPIPL